jgi:two-component system, NtrC family, sensor kinase
LARGCSGGRSLCPGRVRDIHLDAGEVRPAAAVRPVDESTGPHITEEGNFVAKATLLVIQGVDQGIRFEIGEEPAGIGRGVKNRIRILDTEVSRTHATIEYKDNAFVVTDRDSSNGTFVNGVAVRSRVLNSGDRVQFGRSVLLFNEGTDDETSSQVADQVDLSGHFDLDDHSHIVGRVAHGQDLSQELLEASSATVPPQTMVQTLANLQALYRISEAAVSPSITLDQLLQRILDLTIEVVGADRGCLLVAEAESEEIVPRAFSHRRGVDEAAKMPVSRSIVDFVLQENEGVRTSDARTDERFEVGQSILQAGIREAMCVPMQGRYNRMGVIYVDTTTSPQRVLLDGGKASKFTEEQLRLLVAIGRQTALAIEDHRYQQALVKAERLAAMGQTIATLSHHIKNILQGVRGGSYLIDMGLKDHNEELIGKGWSIVEKNQNKIYHLVMDMLTFSKERQPVLESASLNDTVGDVCELMQARADEFAVKFSYAPADDLPATTFDPEGIHRAVLNIVSNAIDAVEGREQGAVLVETGYDDSSDSIYVVVTDNGPGIPEDQLPKIFNIFESTKGSRGTGLGLAVSRKIIREHGGEITVRSKLGEGSQFTLGWPRIVDEQRALDSQTLS